MLVVSDASPIIALVNIDSIQVLAALYEQVIISPTVAEELSRASRPESVRRFIAAPPSWLLVRTPPGCRKHTEAPPG